MTLHLNKNEYDTFKEIIEKNYDKENMEIEVRFGVFLNNNFRPGVDQLTFKRILEYLNSNPSYINIDVEESLSIKDESNNENSKKIFRK